MKNLLFALLVLSGVQAWGQMDMLPFLFRDLPPEWEQGLPEDLTYQEFRQLNRSVDFFTIGMSMVLPGYALQYVEHPELGWPLGLARWSTYGTMALAVGRQWSDMKDVWTAQNISQDQWNNLNTNAWIFGGSLLANGFLWAADVLLAYHLAKDERDYVIYRHGLLFRKDGSSVGDLALVYFRTQQVPAEGDSVLRQRLVPSILKALHSPSRSSGWGELSFYAGDLLFRENRVSEALVTILQGLYQDPGHPLASRSRSLAMTILALEKGLPDRVVLYNLLLQAQDLGSSWDLDALRFFQALPLLESQEIRNLFLNLADSYLQKEKLPPSGDYILFYMSEAWKKSGDLKNQALALAKLVTFYPQSPRAEEARTTSQGLYRDMGDLVAATRLELH